MPTSLFAFKFFEFYYFDGQVNDLQNRLVEETYPEAILPNTAVSFPARNCGRIIPDKYLVTRTLSTRNAASTLREKDSAGQVKKVACQ